MCCVIVHTRQHATSFGWAIVCTHATVQTGPKMPHSRSYVCVQVPMLSRRLFFRLQNAECSGMEDWPPEVCGPVNVDGRPVGTVQACEEEAPKLRAVPLKRVVTFTKKEQWHSVSDFAFEVLEDKGPCLKASCRWEGKTYKCHVAPQEAMVDWAKAPPPPYRLRQLPPYNQAPLCGTVSHIDTDSALLQCLKDGEEGPIEIKFSPVPLKMIWNNTEPGLLRIEQDAETGQGGPPSPPLVELSLLPQPHGPGTPLLLLHDNRLVDATVVTWHGSAHLMKYDLQLADFTILTTDLNAVTAVRVCGLIPRRMPLVV